MNVMRQVPVIGFIGFGQLAATFAKAMARHAVTLCAYDRNLERPGGLERLNERARGYKVRFLSLSRVLETADLLISCVPPGQAVAVADQASKNLSERHTFVDVTSVGPVTKERVRAVVSTAGAGYLEGVVLDAVGEKGADARLLICGEQSGVAVSYFRSVGLNAEDFGPEFGRAATLKMLRSVWSKGIEALYIEALVAAKLSGLETELSQIIDEATARGLGAAVNHWISSHPRACQRRSEEMGEVVETLRSVGLDAIVTSGVRAFFLNSVARGLQQQFSGGTPPVADVIAMLAATYDRGELP